MTSGGTELDEAPEELTLAAEFDDPTRAQWQELVAGVLAKSGREVTPEEAEAALATVTDDGITIAGLYAAEDAPGVDTGVPGLSPFVRGARPEGQVADGWLVRQRHAFPADVEIAEAHDVLMAELENGVSSLWLVLGDAGGPPVAALDGLLEGVFVDLAPIALEAGRDTPDAAAALLRFAEQAGAGAIPGSLGYDPLLDRTQGGPALEQQYRDALVEHARTAAASHPQLRTVVADGLPYHRAGGSDAQELGAALAAGVAALRTLTDAGLSTDEAFQRIEFRFAATADQFATLAKLRAVRRCWDRIGDVSGAAESSRAMAQHAVTSPAMITRRDPWVNMLRSTVAAVGAGLGGAAAVTVLPFDSELGRPDEAARRLARNTQALLLEESHLAHVIDPAGGSWYVESLTDALAHAAWEEFTRIERDGGIEAVLDDGSLAARLDETWQQRAGRIAAPQGPDHRRQRVPEPPRGAPAPRSAPRHPRRGRPAAASLRRGVRDPARPRRRRRGAPHGLPRDHRQARRVHRARVVHPEPDGGRRHRHRRRPGRHGHRGDRERLPRGRHPGRGDRVVGQELRPVRRRRRGRPARGGCHAHPAGGEEGRRRRGRHAARRLRRGRRPA